ncbi:MAG: biotin/lipoyl-containing protein [Thermoplasmata archaeon]
MPRPRRPRGLAKAGRASCGAGGGSTKLVLVLDGERREVDVDLSRQVVRMGAHEWPVHVEAVGDGSVSFEILGERVDVRTHGDGNAAPLSSITVNGEVHTLLVESTAGTLPRAPSWKGAAVVSSHGAPSGRESGDGAGRAVHPPMPGKVLEVRVQNGEKVLAGQVLLVVEAMKMRNEVTSPVAGEVASLHVTPGANVGARDVLLRILVA